jgi:hypothetical protein
MKELVYTSAPAGLRAGTSGFCTVAMSDSLPTPVVEFLERLSNTYRPVFMPYDPRASDNPVAYSLVRARPAGQPLLVLSRNAAAGIDHTGRTNNLAHHLIVSGAGDASNPAALAAQPGTFLRRWDQGPSWLPTRLPRPIVGPSGRCEAWHSLTGDAGWAATVAAAWTSREARPFFVIYPSGTNVLELLSEAISLLPPARRWEATFTTYYTGLPPEAACTVRAVLSGSPQEAEARRGDHIDLMEIGGPAPDGPLADRARGKSETAAVPEAASELVLPARSAASPPPKRSAPTSGRATEERVPSMAQARQTELLSELGSERRPAVRTGGRWGTIFSILFGAWALGSTLLAAILAIGWANTGASKEGEAEYAAALAKHKANEAGAIERAERLKKEAEDQRLEADKRETRLVEERNNAEADRNKWKNEFDELRKSALVKPKPKPPKDPETPKIPDRPPPMDVKVVGSPLEWFKSLEQKAPLDRAIAYHEIPDHISHLQKESKGKVVTGHISLAEEEMEFEKKVGKKDETEKRTVIRVRPSDSFSSLPSEVYELTVGYQSQIKDPKDKGSLTYRPVNEKRVEAKVELRRKQLGVYYIEPSEWKELNELKKDDNWVFLIQAKKEQPNKKEATDKQTFYLAWLREISVKADKPKADK